MAKVIDVQTDEGIVKVLAVQAGTFNSTCKITGIKESCVNTGKGTFTAVPISLRAIQAAHELGIDMTNLEGLKELYNSKDRMVDKIGIVKEEIKMSDEEIKKRDEEIKMVNERFANILANMIVTTGDLKQDYEIIGPVYCQVSNKGVFSSTLSTLIKKHAQKIIKQKNIGQLGQEKVDWGLLYGEFSVGQNDFDKAFFVSVEELKQRAALIGADAIIGMRQDIDLDTNAFQHFYLQMYGTAVKLKEK